MPKRQYYRPHHVYAVPKSLHYRCKLCERLGKGASFETHEELVTHRLTKHGTEEMVRGWLYKGQVLSICYPKPGNENLKGKKVSVYDPRVGKEQELVAARFISEDDVARYSARMYIFFDEELCPVGMK